MKKGLVIAGSIISGLCLVIAAIAFFGAMGFKPESDNILHDTRTDGTTFNFEEGDSFVLQVYAVGTVDCNEFRDSFSVIGANDLAYEYYKPDCDETFDTDDYTYLGDLSISESGTYEINASGEIVITNANSIGVGGIISFASCGCCFIGLILLIVGLVTGKSKSQVMMIQPDGTIIPVQGQYVQQQAMSGQVTSQPQQMVAQPQQYIPQTQETSVEQYSFEQKNDWE
jgi:hypothetical protein